MSAVATTGSSADRLRESIALSETARRRAYTLRRQLRRRYHDQMRASLRRIDMHEPSAAQVSALLNRKVSEDPDWKDAIAEEQWGARLATMYGLALLAEQNDRLISLLNQVHDELRRHAARRVADS